jgi:uncharacterized protein YecE (DUF72 family)
VGPAGWSYEDWRGVVYPSPRPSGFHEAAYLAEFFPVIEINTSFYRPLRPEIARLWAQKVAWNPHFQFTAKLQRGFTHEGNLSRADIKTFCDGLAPLADPGRLGCVLMQFPWSFRLNRENRERLSRLSRAFGHYPLVAEVRHTSWNCDEGLDIFIDHHIGFCNIDQPQLHHCLPPTAHATSPIGYVRLHGRNYQEWFRFDKDADSEGSPTPIQARYNYLYSRQQLERWKTRIEQISGQTRTTYVVTNNHFEGKAVVNALQIMEMVAEEAVDVPPTLMERYPELQASARNTPAQRNLFFMPARRAPRKQEPVERPRLVAIAGGRR